MSPRLLLTLLAVLLSHPGALSAQELADARTISFSLKFTVEPKPKAGSVVLTALVPHTLDGKQKIVHMTYSHKPDKQFTDKGNSYVRFVLENVSAPVDVVVRVDAELYRHDLSVLSARKDAKPEAPVGQQWLDHEKYLEKDSLDIQEVARRIKGKNDLDTLGKIQAFVQKTMKYTGYNGKDIGAVEALRKKEGDCNEFADLFVALCRAKGIRARTCEGYTIIPPRMDDTPKHDWAQVFLAEHGWVPVDPFHIARGAASIERLGTFYIYLSTVRNDQVLDGFHYFAFSPQQGRAEVRDGFIIHKLEMGTK